MKFSSKMLYVLGATALLSGCFGSGGNGLAGVAPATGGNKAALELLQTELSGQPRSTSVPSQGTFKYKGFVNMAPDGKVVPFGSGEVVGQADLDVSFAGGGAMTGTVDNFDDEAGGTYTGQLVVSNGNLGAGANGPEISGDIAGTLVRDSGQSFDINGGLTGGFFGANQEVINGADTVTITSTGQSIQNDIFVLGKKQP